MQHVSGAWRILSWLAGVISTVALSAGAELPAAAAPKFGAPPAWVVPCPFVESPVTDADKARGVVYRLRNEQHNLQTGEDYFHRVYTITSSDGLQDMAEIGIDWAPEYQSATVHFLRVKRDGKTAELATPARFQTMRREQNLMRYSLDGKISSIAVLEDVRVGDTIEFAWTRKGANPVFRGHYSREFRGPFSVRVDRLEYRVLHAATKPLQHHSTGLKVLKHAATQRGPLIDERWSADAVASVTPEDAVPDWFEEFGEVQVSDYQSWAEVVAWGRELFTWKTPLSPELEQKVAEIQAASADAEKRVARAVEFVQDDVRYLSVTMGEGTHRPSAPDEVIRRRYGDCKDKSLLLVAMLQRMGMDVAPALVESSGGAELNQFLPSPTLFDHAIVRLRLDGKTFWIDGTRTHQGSGLGTRFVPDFRMALVLADGETGLTAIDRGQTARSVTAYHDRITSGSFEKPAVIVSEVTYEGWAAESMRKYLANTDKTTVARNAEETMRRYYSGAVELSAPQWKDDPQANRIVFSSSYSLPDFWNKDDPKRLTAELHPTLLYRRLTRFSEPARRAPIALMFPLEYRYRIEASLPAEWAQHRDSDNVDGPGFRFRSEARCSGRSFNVNYEWSTTGDNVAAASANEYGRKIGKVIDSLGYKLTHGGTAVVPASFRLQIPLLAVSLFLFFGVLSWVWRFTSRQPDPAIAARSAREIDRSLVGIGGWLILIAIGVCLLPFFEGRALWETAAAVLDQSIWERFTTQSSKSYEPYFAFFGTLELVFGVANFTLALFLPFLFFRRHYRFPAVMILSWALRLAALASLIISQSYLTFFTDAQRAANLALVPGLLVPLLIWVPYLVRSRRVRATFVRGWRRPAPPPLPSLAVQGAGSEGVPRPT